MLLQAPPTTTERIARYRSALTRSDTTPSAAYLIASEAASDPSNECRVLACMLFWTSAQLGAPTPLPTISVFERLCGLAASDPCSKVRLRACQLLASLPSAPPDAVERALHKRAEMPPVPKAATKGPSAAESAALDASEIERLTTVGVSNAADASTAMGDAALREAACGALHIALEDRSASIRGAAVVAVVEHVWPDGPDHPCCVPNLGHAVALLVDSCGDPETDVRLTALDRLRHVAPILRLRQPQVAAVGSCVVEDLVETAPQPAAGSVVHSALALLEACRYDGKSALAEAQRSLVVCRRCHPTLDNAVRQSAEAMGAVNFRLTLGASGAGAHRLAASYAAAVSEGRAAGDEEVIAHHMLLGAERARAARTADMPMEDEDENEGVAGGEGVAERGGPDAYDEDQDGDEDEDAEAQLEAGWDGAEPGLQGIESEPGALEITQGEPQPEPVREPPITRKRPREASSQRPPAMPAAGSASTSEGRVPPTARERQEGGHLASRPAAGAAAALKDCAAALASAGGAKALPALKKALGNLRAAMSSIQADDGSGAGDDAGVPWLQLRLRMALHVCEVCARLSAKAAPSPAEPSPLAACGMGMVRASYGLQYGFGNEATTRGGHAKASRLLWLSLCRLWAHVVLQLEALGGGGGTPGGPGLSQLCLDQGQLMLRIEQTQAAIAAASTSAASPLAEKALTRLRAIPKVGSTDGAPSAARLTSWLLAHAALAAHAVESSPDATDQPAVGYAPREWTASIRVTPLASAAMGEPPSDLGPRPALARTPTPGQSPAGSLVRLKGTINVDGIPWRECVLAAGRGMGTGSGHATSAGLELFDLPIDHLVPAGKHRYVLTSAPVRLLSCPTPAVGTSAAVVDAVPKAELVVGLLRRFFPDVAALDLPLCTQDGDRAGCDGGELPPRTAFAALGVDASQQALGLRF